MSSTLSGPTNWIMTHIKTFLFKSSLFVSVNVNRLKDFEETKRHEMMMERQMMENVKRSGHEMTHIAVSINHHQHWEP